MKGIEIDSGQYREMVSRHYDDESKEYDGVYNEPIQLAEDAAVMRLIEPYVMNGQRVLDIGCGTGLPLSYLDISKYIGMDISAGMIAQAKKDHPGKVFTVGDMHGLPAADESVDTVISLYGPFSYSLKPKSVVSEINRVLRPGGTILVMPYTTRVGHGLEMGGYSTASASDIPKTFYNSQMLRNLFSGFSDVAIIGINYFGNTLRSFDKAMGTGLSQKDYEKQLVHEIRSFAMMPDIQFARHAMVIAHKPSVVFSARGAK